ncbi:MAG: type II toxin-antitoxin system antitoxin SocA domain-containing protein [Bacteroidota bacterium]
MATDVLNIASFFVRKGVSPLQLQKLLYYSQVWYVVKENEKLFDQDIKAWIYGPVVAEIWENFRYIKRTSIIPKDRLDSFDTPLLYVDHLEEVWYSYGHLSGSQLVDLTHSELPWRSSRIGLLKNQPSHRPVIINEETLKYYNLVNGRIPFIPPTFSRGEYSNNA